MMASMKYENSILFLKCDFITSITFFLLLKILLKIALLVRPPHSHTAEKAVEEVIPFVRIF